MFNSPSPRALTAACAAVVVLLAGLPTSAGAATLQASPGNLSSVFGSAGASDVIELASGDYGTFSGGQKVGVVTIEPAAGASATVSVAFTAAVNVRLVGLTIPSASIGGRSSNVTISGSRFTGSVTVDASTMSSAGISFDGDVFDGIDACGSCYEGRLTVRGNNNSAPVGVSVTNSHFGNGGASDGVQVVGDAYGVQIGPGNEFSGLKQGTYAAHIDSIQLYGSSHTQIIGNYFHDDDTIVMAPDGGDHEFISDNVMVGDGYVPAVQLGSHVGTSFVHNTTKNIDVHMDHKSGAAASSSGIIKDNVIVNGSFNALDSGNCTGCTVDHNLFTAANKASGTNTVIGTPIFAGGANPTTFAGFQLATGSPGIAAASDGANLGARVGVVPGPPGTPPTVPGSPPKPPATNPTSPTTGASSAGATPAGGSDKAATALRPKSHVTLYLTRHIGWTQFVHGIGVKVKTAAPVRVTLALTRVGSTRSLVRQVHAKPGGTRRYVLRPARARLGHPHSQLLVLRVAVTNSAGRQTLMRRAIRVTL